jgi:putative SbcD/Mre11-related phosphoesterase
MMRFCDEWLLLPQRIAVHTPSGTAVIADVHLGYTAARQRQGDAIPSRSVMDEMQPLVAAAMRHDIRALVVAGDLFEAGYDADLHRRFADALERLRINFLGLVPGNHDRGIEQARLTVHVDGYDVAGWRVVHGDRPFETDHVIAGHWHPATRWRGRKVPCFLSHGTRLILPAFSLDAAGSQLPWREWRRHVIDVLKVRNG